MNPKDMMQAEMAQSYQAAQNILVHLKAKTLLQKARRDALRAQYIEPNEITG